LSHDEKTADDDIFDENDDEADDSDLDNANDADSAGNDNNANNSNATENDKKMRTISIMTLSINDIQHQES
jgi:hypothetical protein